METIVRILLAPQFKTGKDVLIQTETAILILMNFGPSIVVVMYIHRIRCNGQIKTETVTVTIRELLIQMLV